MLDQHIRNYSQNIAPNTIIGGIAKQGGTGVNAPVDTAYKLATKLGISINRISGFRIIGDDVSFKIKGTYSLPDGVFGHPNSISSANQNITSFIDHDNLVVGLLGGSNNTFSRCMNMEYIKLNGLTTISNTDGVFRNCTHPNLTVEMIGLKNVSGSFFSQLPNSFNQTKYSSLSTIENIGTLFIHNSSGFTEVVMPNLKTIVGGQNFFAANNVTKFIMNEVTTITGTSNGTWRHGNSTCKLIELKKCKTLPNVLIALGADVSTSIIHNSDFTMRMNEAVSGHASLLAIKSAKPHAVIEFYDDNGDYVSSM
jgi:hypothetical protein